MTTSAHRPTIALAMGDPAGISPELTAKALASPAIRDLARFIVIGDARVLAMGARDAKVTLDVATIKPNAAIPADAGKPVFVDLGHLDPARIERGQISKEGGASALENLDTALALAVGGAADAVAFTPFNKAAMRLAYPPYEDEIVYGREVLGIAGKTSEFNVLEGLWNARVTSHVPLKDVSKHITRETVIDGLKLTSAALQDAGFKPARIGVAALNPHAGDGGNFGREEIDVIGPAVEEAKAMGIACEGPYPSDTVFVRARRGQFDAVLTMYHDQGQIAMKLIGFESGVTLLGGFPFPITTPAHGTAYDIAGKGIANLGATEAALRLGAKMGAARPRVSAAAAGKTVAELRTLIRH